MSEPDARPCRNCTSALDHVHQIVVNERSARPSCNDGTSERLAHHPTSRRADGHEVDAIARRGPNVPGTRQSPEIAEPHAPTIFDAMNDPEFGWDQRRLNPDGTAQQVEPPRFDAPLPHPSSPAGSIWMTGAVARRIGGVRLRLVFRVALLAGLIAVVVAALP
jgi:hypothetical protein